MNKNKKTQLTNNFIEWLVETHNDEVYYQMKRYLENNLEEDEDFGEMLDFMVENVKGHLVWTE